MDAKNFRLTRTKKMPRSSEAKVEGRSGQGAWENTKKAGGRILFKKTLPDGTRLNYMSD